MPQTAQTTTPEELSGPDGDATIEDIVRNMNATVEMVLTHGTDAVTTRGRDSQTAISPFTNSEQGAAGLANVVALPPARPPRKPSVTFHALQEWEGYVTEIGHKDFTANLLDLTAGETYAGEEAVIPLVEIWEADAAKMQVGSIFRWVIGYQRSVVGTKERVSRIVFRDLPAFTKNEIQAAEEWAETTKAVFEE